MKKNRTDQPIVIKRKLYDGKIFDLYCDDILNKETLHRFKREYIHLKNNASCVLAKLEDDKFVFVKQFRHPIHQDTFEIPAGKIEKNEDPKMAAIREFEEEVGYKVLNISYLGSYYPSAGCSDEEIFIYYADKFKKTQQNFDENENIEVVLLTFSQIKEYIKEGKIKDSKTLAALGLYYLE